MMPTTANSLSLAIAASLLLVAGAGHAAALAPGQSATVQPGDTPEEWALDGATLNVNPGGNTLAIFAFRQSNLRIDGAQVAAASVDPGISLQNSSLTLSNSTVNNSDARGMALASGTNTAGGSTANISNSQITGLGLGISVFSSPAGRSILTLDRTQVLGRMNGTATPLLNGNGILVLESADTLVANGSVVTGEANGIYATGSTALGFDSASTLVIDASRVEGKGGAALVVGAPRLPTIPDPDILFTARNGAQLIGSNGNILEVSADAATVGFTVDNSNLTGNIINTGGSTVDVALRNGAKLVGSTSNITSMSLDNARWQMSGNSSTGTLALGSNSELAFGDGSAFHTLNVGGNFTGNGGTLVFNTVFAGDGAGTDKLVIGGDSSGSANVRVNNIGGAGAATNQGIELISVGGASNGQFTLQGRAVAGEYEYLLHKGATDGNWYLRSALLPGEADPCKANPALPECAPVGPGPEPLLRPEGGAYLANLQAAQNMFRLGYHDRQAGQNGGRAWARVDGARHGFDATSRQLDITGNSQALTVGADLWRDVAGSSVGVMLSSGNASSTSTNALTGYYARGKVKGEALGLYGTWRVADAADPYAGFYLDGSLQRAQFRNRVEGVALASERYDSRAWQGAVETGYAFRIGGASNGGLFLEPQLQVGYTRWGDVDHTEVNGTRVTTRDEDGVFGRAGVRLSGVTRWGNGSTDVQPYVAAHWLHNRSRSDVLMDGEQVDGRIPRSRGEFSAGASLRFANDVGIWAGIARQQGQGYHQTSAQLGVNYRW